MASLLAIVADITTLEVDAIANAANRDLAGGGGVDGAIHRACGPDLVVAGRALSPCPTGEVRTTRAFRLEPRVRWILHTVGPIWSRHTPDEADALLASCYRSCLAAAEEVGARSVAFPAISTGVYGFPQERAAAIAVATCREAPAGLDDIFLVAFDARTARLYEDELKS